MVQGARSILGGIQNLHLANDQDIPTLLVRQQGKLPPPLLTSTAYHSNLSLPDGGHRKQSLPPVQGTTDTVDVHKSPARSARVGQSVLKASAATPVPSSLLTGRLNRQAKGRTSLQSAPAAAAGSPAAAPDQSLGESAAMTPPAADAADPSQLGGEAAQTPSQWTQEQWDSYMQSGSSAPTPTVKASGRKKAVRPVLKKQRINTMTLD